MTFVRALNIEVIKQLSYVRVVMWYYILTSDAIDRFLNHNSATVEHDLWCVLRRG